MNNLKELEAEKKNWYDGIVKKHIKPINDAIDNLQNNQNGS